MKKIKLLVIVFLLSIGLIGCQKATEPEARNNAYEGTYQLYYFYLETCPKCKAFEEEALPLIEEEFGEHLEIIKYDLDAYETKEPYDKIVDKILDFDMDNGYGRGPFIVLDNYFVKIGYSSGDEQELVDDFIRAIKGKPLGTELKSERYIFKDGKIKE